MRLQRFYDRVLLHLGEAPSALTTGKHMLLCSCQGLPTCPPAFLLQGFDPSTVKPPAFKLGSWHVPTHHANKLSGTLHALSRDWAKVRRVRILEWGTVSNGVIGVQEAQQSVRNKAWGVGPNFRCK